MSAMTVSEMQFASSNLIVTSTIDRASSSSLKAELLPLPGSIHLSKISIKLRANPKNFIPRVYKCHFASSFLWSEHSWNFFSWNNSRVKIARNIVHTRYKIMYHQNCSNQEKEKRITIWYNNRNLNLLNLFLFQSPREKNKVEFKYLKFSLRVRRGKRIFLTRIPQII